MIRFKKETPHWGYIRITDYIVYLGYKIGETAVKNILIENGYDPEPGRTRKTICPTQPRSITDGPDLRLSVPPLSSRFQS